MSSNGRHLVRSDGTPFFYLGDTAWELFHRLSYEEADSYLQDRAAKGFTVVQAVILSELGGLTEPNANGDLPLADQDPTRPNEAYFAHVDRIIDRAKELGLVMGVLPTWGKYWKQAAGDGLSSPQTIFDPDNAFEYGEYLGSRYATADLIWILGGDADIETAFERETIDRMALGLRSGDQGEHLLTFHPRGPGMSSQKLSDASWIDFHMCQSSHGARDHDNGLFVSRDYAREPARPALDGEPRYEDIPVGFYLAGMNPTVRFDAFDVRQAAYWAILAGACGHTYGNNNVWQMWDHGRTPVINAGTPWRVALNHPGAFQMGHLRALCTRYPPADMVPWETIEPVEATGGFLLDAPSTGGHKVRAGVAQDRSWALVYSPYGSPFTLDRTLLQGTPKKTWWFDPRYGTWHLLKSGDTSAIQTYVPPTSGRGQDWVLVVDVRDTAVDHRALERTPESI